MRKKGLDLRMSKDERKQLDTAVEHNLIQDLQQERDRNYTRASSLKIGDIIVERDINGRILHAITVRQLELCRTSRKGVLKIHVNGSNCYDTLGLVEVK